MDNDIMNVDKMRYRQRIKEERCKTAEIGNNGYLLKKEDLAGNKVDLMYAKESDVRERRKKTL